jgi:hypothetical protein
MVSHRTGLTLELVRGVPSIEDEQATSSTPRPIIPSPASESREKSELVITTLVDASTVLLESKSVTLALGDTTITVSITMLHDAERPANAIRVAFRAVLSDEFNSELC